MLDKNQLAKQGHKKCTIVMTDTSTLITRWLIYNKNPSIELQYYRYGEYNYKMIKHWQYKAVLLPYILKEEKKIKDVCDFGGYYSTPTRWYNSNWIKK